MLTPRRAITLISTACSWVNIVGGQKATIIAQVGLIYSDGVGQYYIGANNWLSHYLFESIAEVQDYATRWLWFYNYERPNMALGGITPKQRLAMAA